MEQESNNDFIGSGLNSPNSIGQIHPVFFDNDQFVHITPIIPVSPRFRDPDMQKSE